MKKSITERICDFELDSLDHSTKEEILDYIEDLFGAYDIGYSNLHTILDSCEESSRIGLYGNRLETDKEYKKRITKEEKEKKRKKESEEKHRKYIEQQAKKLGILK